MVPADAKDIAELVGSRTGDDTDKFERCEWTPGPGGTPILAACRNWFTARTIDRVPAGEHWRDSPLDRNRFVDNSLARSVSLRRT